MRLVVDIETNGLYKDVSQIHCIVAKEIGGTYYIYHLQEDKLYEENIAEYSTIQDMFHLLLNADQIIGHNFIDYDMRAIEKLYGIKLDINKIVDTMLLSYMLNPGLKRHKACPASKETIKGRKLIGPHSLENWGYYLGQGKIEYEDWSTFTPKMLERCKGDVEITEKLYKHFIG